MALVEVSLQDSPLQALLALLTALGTFGAFVALVVLEIRRSTTERSRAPKLRLATPGVIDFDRIQAGTQGGLLSYWLQLRVENFGTGKSAHQVQVELRDIFDAEGKRVPVNDMPLNWSNLGADPQTLPPGSSRSLDLFSFLDPKGGPAKAAPCLVAPPFDERHMLREGTYRLTLALLAEDLPRTTYQLSFRFSGVWSPAPDLFWPGATVSGLVVVGSQI